jgi:AcrR family transcriptional regulator
MTEPGASPRGRPRDAELDRRILASAVEVLKQSGAEAVNIAAVGAHAGLARTTVYRRFKDRAALLEAALRELTHRGAPAEGTTLVERLGWLLRETDALLAGALGPGGVATVLRGEDEEFAVALRRALADGLAPVRQQVSRDVERGVLDPALEAELVVNLVLGAYLAEWLRVGTPTARWRTETAAHLADILGPRVRGLPS